MNDQPLRPDATGPDRTPDRLPTYTVGEMAAMAATGVAWALLGSILRTDTMR